MIRYPQENTNTEALSGYSWRHGGQQLYKNSLLTPMSPKKHTKIKHQPPSRITTNDHLILLPLLVAIKKATISGKNNNDNKTDFYWVKVKH